MADPLVLSAIRREARRRRAPYKHVKAAVETGLVESNLENLSGGDRDSAGWRQERASIYKDPTNLAASVKRFFDEAAQHDRPGLKSGELAARVQRPAAEYRGRYAERAAEAAALLRGEPRTPSGEGAAAAPTLRTAQTFDQPGFEQAQRRATLGSFLSQRRGPNSVLFRSGLLGTTQPNPQDFTTLKTIRTNAAQASTGLAGGQVNTAISEARKRLGIREVGTSNRSKAVDEMQRSFGMVGQAWCGIFVGTALRAAGVKGVNSRVASVQLIEDDAKAGANGFQRWLPPREAQPGDALVTRKGGHVVFVERVDRKRGVIHTIGGNTSNGAVERVTYSMGGVHGVARPRYRR